MKKLFIGLLIIAAGAGAYYFLQKKKSEPTDKLDKELLVGKWKMGSAIKFSPIIYVHFGADHAWRCGGFAGL